MNKDKLNIDETVFKSLALSCDDVILFVGNAMLKQHCKPADRASKSEELKKDGFIAFNDVVFVQDTKEDMINAIGFLSDVYVNYVDSPIPPTP